MTAFFNELLSMAFEASVLIVVILAIRLIFRKMPKQFKKALWGLVGIKLLIPFSFKSPLSLMPKTPDLTADGVTAAPHGVAETVTVLDYAPYIWLCVSVLLILYGVISFAWLKLKLSDAVRDSDNVYLSEKADSPFVCGFVKPKIYLPFNLDDETKNYVLQHEKRHIKNADHILKALSFLLVCLYWFNPLVWVAHFLFCKDVELVCDNAVVKNLSDGERKNYARALLKIGTNKVKIYARPVSFGEVSIKERIFSVVNYKRITKSAVIACVGLCVAIAACFMTEPYDENNIKKSPSKTNGVITETVPPVATEPVTEQATEPVTEQATEPVTEPAPTEAPEKSVRTTAAPAPKEETPPTLSPESRAFLESLHTQIHIPDEHYTQPNVHQFPETDNDNSHMDIPGYAEEINLFPGNPTPDPYASSPSPYYN